MRRKIVMAALILSVSGVAARALVGNEGNIDLPRAGGLTSYPSPMVSGNLLSNAGFEQGSVAWTADGFSVDRTVVHSGQSSLRLTNDNLIPHFQSATQTLQLKKGVYNIGGWVKVSGLGATTGDGVRFCLFAPVAFPWNLTWSCTAAIKGTADWQYLQMTTITVPQDTPALFSVDAYKKPDGTFWVDDLVLTRSQFPLQSFMLYPNYRGLLFDDQSQVARFNITLDPPGDDLPTDFVLNGQVTDESTGTVVLQNSFPAAASLTASFDCSSLLVDHSYLVSFQIQKPDGRQPYSYPAYRIVKVSGSIRDSMNVSFDEQNRFLLHGKPTFILGVYDSGMGYTNSAPQWEDQLATDRHLFELPINFYLNYWYGAMPNSALLPLLDVLQSHGIYALTNANCFQNQTVEQMGQLWLLNGPVSERPARAASPAFGGFYAADECSASLVSNVFGHYQLMKTVDPGGIVLGVEAGASDIALWRDAVDVAGPDSYPMYGAEPAQGYPFYRVADDAKTTSDALLGSRPFVSVLQFFQFTSRGRWPTQAELRSMSYAAIVGGANGLFYWSLGANALAYICDGSDAYHSPRGSNSWCQARLDNQAKLKSVLTELKALSPVLAMPDRPDLLADNSNSTVRTRVKYDGTTAYLITYNASNSQQSAIIHLAVGPKSVSTLREGTALALRQSSFTDSFDPYEARVYKIGLYSAPSSSPIPLIGNPHQ